MPTATTLAGKVCLVTGANAGIGKGTALGLARLGATVVMVARDQVRGEAALAEIRQKSDNPEITLLLADLSSQAAIRHLAAEFKQRFTALHVLINNAGLLLQTRTVTVDGLETQFAVNHLAPFLLTNLLLDRLISSTPARIITVSSQVHRGASLDFSDLQSEKSYHPTGVYAETKLANILFTYELARRLTGRQVTANCLHPGVVSTNLLSAYMGRTADQANPAESELAQGAKMSLYLATSAEVEGVSGKYFERLREARSSPESYDEASAQRLWQASAKLVDLA